MNAKLVKAEMLNQTDLVDRYRREIEALKRNVSNQISSGHQPTLHGCTSTSRSTKPDLLDQLNKLNSKLTKAEFLCQSDLVEQYKNEIQLLQDKYEKCLDEKQTANRKSAVSGDKAYTDELNKLGSKLAKAELLNQTDLIVKYKSQIEQLKSGNSKSSELIAVGDDSSKRKQTEKALERLNPEEYSKELNRLGSRLAKAEMMNQVDLVDLLQSQIDQLKRRHGHETDMKEELEEDINRELSNRYHSSYNNKKQINERDGGSDGSTFTQSGSYGPSRQPFYLKASGLDRSKSADGKSTSFGQSRKLIEFTKKISENNMSLKQMVTSFFLLIVISHS